MACRLGQSGSVVVILGNQLRFSFLSRHNHGRLRSHHVLSSARPLPMIFPRALTRFPALLFLFILLRGIPYLTVGVQDPENSTIKLSGSCNYYHQRVLEGGRNNRDVGRVLGRSARHRCQGNSFPRPPATHSKRRRCCQRTFISNFLLSPRALSLMQDEKAGNWSEHITGSGA